MLKLNYTEVGLYMERVMSSVEMLIAERVVLAMRLGQTLHVEPGRASFLLPKDSLDRVHLEAILQQKCSKNVSVIPVDDGFVEISLCGSWIAESADAHEGMFLTVMSERAEFLVYKLWHESQVHVSSLA
jgi:predicted component of type VI protein secretion system